MVITQRLGDSLTVRLSDENRHGPWGYTVLLFGETVTADCGFGCREDAKRAADAEVRAWAEYLRNVAAEIEEAA